MGGVDFKFWEKEYRDVEFNLISLGVIKYLRKVFFIGIY